MAGMASTTRELASHAGGSPLPAPVRHAGRWRDPLLLGLLVVAAGMAYTVWFFPVVLGWPGWWLNGEVWIPVDAAGYVASGAYPYLYEAHPGWIAGPLLPVVLAPVALLQDAFHLTSNGDFNVPHPTLWLVYGPLGLATSIPLLHAVRSLAAGVRSPGRHGDRGLAVLQWAVLPLVLAPAAIVFGHFEDVLALAFLVLATRDAPRGGLRGALYLGIAIAFKQWAVLGLPILFVAVSPERRARWVAGAVAVPAVLMGIPLVADWPHAAKALFSGSAFPMLGHPALWVGATGEALTAAPYRLVILAGAVGLARKVRGRMDAPVVLAALGLVFLVRLVLEPVVFGYYPCPALAFLLLHEYATTGRVRRTLALGTAMLLLFPFHPNPVLWWTAEAALGVALAVPAVREVRGQSKASRPVSDRGRSDPG